MVFRCSNWQMFPDETSARNWFESIIWENDVARCHRCVGTNTYEVPSGKQLSHRCRNYREQFSFRQGIADAERFLQRYQRQFPQVVG